MVAAEFSEREVRFLLDLSRRLAMNGRTSDRQSRMLHGLCVLAGASTGVATLLDGEFNVVGEPAIAERAVSSQSCATPFANSTSFDNPLIQPAIQQALKHYMASTAQRDGDLPRQQFWQGSRFFRRFLERLGLGDCILSVVSLPRLKPFMSAVCLSGARLPRSIRVDPNTPARFTSRKRRSAHIAHCGLRWVYYSAPGVEEQRMSAPVEYAIPARSSATDLAPRYQRVLDHLLAGGSEKALADQLGLSRHTIHEYVRAIYKKFNVNSRSELMAHWVEA